MHNVLAMVLAGGRGKRMEMLCYDRPKPVLPFAGKFRVIDFSLSNCIHSQISQIALLSDYQRSSLAGYAQRWRAANSGGMSCDVLEPVGGSYRGTADAVYQNLGYLNRHGVDRVLVLAGDHIYKMDYRKMLAFHDGMKADVTVGVIPVPVEQASRFGTVTLDAEHRITEFVEKSSATRNNLASMGMYIFNTETLAKRLVEDAAEPNSPHDFGYAVIPGMVKRDRVYAFKFDGYWQDMGTIEAYYAANMELARDKSSFCDEGKWPILTENHLLPSPRVSNQSIVRNSTISPGCVIKGRVENSILSPGVWVEEQAVVKDSIVMSNSFIGYHSVVDHCVLDEGVSVGKLCYIGFRTASGNAEVTILGKGATIPAHTAIGSNCRVLPHVSQVDFASNMVPSGTVVSSRGGDGQFSAQEKVTA